MDTTIFSPKSLWPLLTSPRGNALESPTLGEEGGDIGLLNISGTNISQCLNLGRCQGRVNNRTVSTVLPRWIWLPVWK